MSTVTSEMVLDRLTVGVLSLSGAVVNLLAKQWVHDTCILELVMRLLAARTRLNCKVVPVIMSTLERSPETAMPLL